MNNLFIKLFSSYVIAMIFFMGLLPRIITNSLNSDKSEIKENRFINTVDFYQYYLLYSIFIYLLYSSFKSSLSS